MKKLLFLLPLIGLATLSGCVSTPGKVTSTGTSTGQIWFYPMVGTENYYSPQKGKGNLMLVKSGQNYWYKDDEGKVVWLYPQGDRFYSPRADGKQVWCYRSGTNLYCQQ